MNIDELTAAQHHEVAAVWQTPDRLAGIVEVNEAFALKSLKGRLSREQVSVSIAASAKTCLQIAN